MYSVFENMTFEEIVDFTIEKYSNENGRAKLHTLYEKVVTSNKLSGLISTSKYRMVAPTATDVISCYVLSHISCSDRIGLKFAQLFFSLKNGMKKLINHCIY